MQKIDTVERNRVLITLPFKGENFTDYTPRHLSYLIKKAYSTAAYQVGHTYRPIVSDALRIVYLWGTLQRAFADLLTLVEYLHWS